MNPSRVTPSDVFSWIRRHFRNRILFHFITTDKVALTSLRRVTLGESPSLPELPRLQHEENNEAFVQNEGPRGLGAGLPGPGGPVLTISDSAGVRGRSDWVPTFLEKHWFSLRFRKGALGSLQAARAWPRAGRPSRLLAPPPWSCTALAPALHRRGPEAQRGRLTCLRSHSWQVAELGFEPGTFHCL